MSCAIKVFQNGSACATKCKAQLFMNQMEKQRGPGFGKHAEGEGLNIRKDCALEKLPEAP